SVSGASRARRGGVTAASSIRARLARRGSAALRDGAEQILHREAEVEEVQPDERRIVVGAAERDGVRPHVPLPRRRSDLEERETAGAREALPREEARVRRERGAHAGALRGIEGLTLELREEHRAREARLTAGERRRVRAGDVHPGADAEAGAVGRRGLVP